VSPRAASIPLRRLTRGGVIPLAIVLAAAAAVALTVFGDPAPSRPAASDARRPAPHLRPLRVTSGHEIATGFAAGGNRVVTVAHVLDGAAAVNGRPLRVGRVLRGQLGEVLSVRARVLRIDRRSDLALLAAPGLAARSTAAPGLAARGTAAPGLAARGVEIEAAGSGASVRVLRLRNGRTSPLSVHVRRAIVARVRAPGAARAVTRPALELAARVMAGDSGAPVVSSSGALAGVVFATSRARERTAYAVDASAVRRLLARG